MSQVTPIRIGDLRHRLRFEVMGSQPDGQGGVVTSWTEFATIWGKLEPKSATERFFSQQTQVIRTHVCTIRYTSGVAPGMRVFFNDRYFQVKGIRQPDEREFFMVIDLMEGVAS